MKTAESFQSQYSTLYKYLLGCSDGGVVDKDLMMGFGRLIEDCDPRVVDLALHDIYDKRVDAVKAPYAIACTVQGINKSWVTEKYVKIINDFARSLDLVSKEDKKKLLILSNALNVGSPVEDALKDLFPSAADIKPKDAAMMMSFASTRGSK